jgi:hypothetical protein
LIHDPSRSIWIHLSDGVVVLAECERREIIPMALTKVAPKSYKISHPLRSGLPTAAGVARVGYAEARERIDSFVRIVSWASRLAIY